MNEILVIAPTRDRPQDFVGLCESFANTSTHAELVGYVDDDQHHLYDALQLPERCRMHFGQRQGPVFAVNTMAHLNRDPIRIYGVAPDDSRFMKAGWDDYLVEAFERFPKRIGVVSPAHSCGDYVNFPYVSREWIEVVGWMAYPHAYHFIWDTLIEILAESSNCIEYAPADKFLFFHEQKPAINLDRYSSDAHSFLMWCVGDRRSVVKRVRDAIRA